MDNDLTSPFSDILLVFYPPSVFTFSRYLCRAFPFFQFSTSDHLYHAINLTFSPCPEKWSFLTFLASVFIPRSCDLWRFEARCFPSERRCDTCFSGSRGPHSMWSFPVLSFCLLCSLFHFSLQLRYHISTLSSTIEGHFGCFSQA